MQIRYGEVLRVIYTDDNPNLLYGIEVKILNSDPVSVKDPETSTSVITAKPLNINFKRMPIVGEIVALLNAPTSYSSGLRNTADIYYFSIVSAQSNIHHNAVPTVSQVTAQFTATNGNSNQYQETSAGNTNTPSTPKLDTNFTENSNVQSLQPYIGDVIIEGRYGNSIRFSTSPKSGTFTLSPRWEGGSQTAPITIIRNTLQSSTPSKINGFTTENFNTDDSTIVLSSGQELEFEVDSKALTAAKANKLTSWQTERFGTTPQILSTSGRILLNSRLKEIGLLSKAGILLSTDSAVTIDAATKFVAESSKIELGNNANEPLILGNAFNSWMNQLVTALSTVTPIHPVVGPCLPLAATPQWPAVLSLLSQIPTILSQVAFTKRITGLATSSPLSELPKSEFTLSESQIQEKEAERDELRNTYQDDTLTQEERLTISDRHNIRERELVDGQSISESIEESVDIQNSNETANTISTVIYNGEVVESDAIQTPEEEFDDIDIVADETYDYLDNNNVDRRSKTFVEISLTEESRQKGLDVVQRALQDVGVTDVPIGSKTGPRVDVYLQNIQCRPKKAEWGNGCIATWMLESGLPIPPTGFASANGWYEWANNTGRWCSTPIIGSVAVYGVKKANGNYNCHNMAIVVEILNNSRILTVEGNVNSTVVQAESNISAVLGFILPSESDILKPIVDYDEGFDNSKGIGSEPSPTNALINVNDQQKSRIRRVIQATLSLGQSKGKCARYTYNHALNWKRIIRNQQLTEGAKYSAGGNANSPGYHRNLERLGWSRIQDTVASKNEVVNYINTNTNFAPGDVVCYWCLTDASISAGKYGHTQIYTARAQANANSNWATDNNSNYNTGFVYGSTPSSSRWKLLHFRAPVV